MGLSRETLSEQYQLGGILYYKTGQITRIRLPAVIVPKGTILIPYCHTLIPKQKHLRRFAKLKPLGNLYGAEGRPGFRACVMDTFILALQRRQPNLLIISLNIDVCQWAKSACSTADIIS